MKTFFYTVAYPNCDDGCDYKTCSTGYFTKLQAMAKEEEYFSINGSLSYRPHSVKPLPQTGDIVILFAKNSSELAVINTRCESFEGMKKVLVVGDSSSIDGSMYHKLAPRYITQASRAVEELEQVLHNMKTPINQSS